ncbi:NADH dehydrogenase [ubiquinone] iron-sulfur protein 5-like [Penaeus japonicus]|uniref:NADH dehydrogenase [ubiquinone] iron-sulfur protein 5-like n=1 Tax=Penaeus japonicus TaxID=27405 RepID=UPI001C70EA71|nr:NADH dehydrogenase [ubiquinone] iron-sulfur protein 5-like [Penaeus japonicus]
MAAHFAPTFRTPLTDLTGGIMTHQSFTKCADFEMRAMECLEAYGVQVGRSKCQDYLDDLRECMFQTKQLARVNAMRQERHRQWIMGERSSENHYAPAARIDGY